MGKTATWRPRLSKSNKHWNVTATLNMIPSALCTRASSRSPVPRSQWMHHQERMSPRWFRGVEPNQVLPRRWLFVKTCPECHRFQTSRTVLVSPHKRKGRSRAVKTSESLGFVFVFFTCQWQRGEEHSLNHFVSLDGLQRKFNNLHCIYKYVFKTFLERWVSLYIPVLLI